MSSQLSPPAPPPRHWAARLFRGRGRSTPNSSAAGDSSAAGTHAAADRYVLALLKESAETIEERYATSAWETLEAQMALVPAGVVPLIRPTGGAAAVEVAAFYLDRHAVTNEQYRRFVAAGCYDDLAIWPREIWPALMRFTDRGGRPGPRDWEAGRYPSGRADHPVVGVCWYEAAAYARWVGKRLPEAAEWQKAAGWPQQLSGGACRRYPWGDVFAEGRANLALAGLGTTAAVHAFPAGATPNGISQLTGNVWEWTADRLEAIPCQPGEVLKSADPLRRILGGAFDTYLPSEASNQFITGQPELDRRGNIGFRCAVALERLRPAPAARSTSR